MSVQLTNFLQKENKILKQENYELKQLLQLNRKALNVAVKNDEHGNNFPGLIKLLYEQNSKLHKKINEMKVELESGMCQALISEQIAFASTEQEKNLTSELREKLTRMRKELYNRENRINQLLKEDLECRKEIKIVQVADLNSLTEKLENKIINLSNKYQQKKQQANKYKEQKEDLLKLNLLLTKQINELKNIYSQQTTKSNDYNQEPGKSSDLSKFLNYQKKIVADDESESEDYDDYSQQSSQLSSDSQVNQSMTEQLETSMKPKLKLQMQKIPKLQLSRAKQIQNILVQKINEEGKKKMGTVKQQKYRKLQEQMNLMKKKIGSILIQKIQLQKQNSFLTKIVKQLENRNELLLKSFQQSHSQQTQNNYHPNFEGRDTETLIDICRDVTLNHILKDTINGQRQLQYRPELKSHDI